MDYLVTGIDLQRDGRRHPEGTVISLDPEVGDKIKWLRRAADQPAPAPAEAAPPAPDPVPAPAAPAESKSPRKGGRKK